MLAAISPFAGNATVSPGAAVVAARDKYGRLEGPSGTPRLQAGRPTSGRLVVQRRYLLSEEHARSQGRIDPELDAANRRSTGSRTSGGNHKPRAADAVFHVLGAACLAPRQRRGRQHPVAADTFRASAVPP
jgi:hypothetical protein